MSLRIDRTNSPLSTRASETEPSINLIAPSVSDGWGWVIRIKDNGGAQTIGYGTQYRAVGVTLPTTTVAGKTLYLGGIWNAAATKVDIVAVQQEV